MIRLSLLESIQIMVIIYQVLATTSWNDYKINVLYISMLEANEIPIDLEN